LYIFHNTEGCFELDLIGLILNMLKEKIDLENPLWRWTSVLMVFDLDEEVKCPSALALGMQAPQFILE
jgi:hypothetical protein